MIPGSAVVPSEAAPRACGPAWIAALCGLALLTSSAASPPTSAPSAEQREANRLALEEERLARKIVAQWFVKVKAIYDRRMAKEPTDLPSSRFLEARRQILAIEDPFALPALTRVLGAGNLPARRVLVESLAQFPQDESTMNLVILALLDPSAEIRRQASLELLPRKDDRVVNELIAALHSDEDYVLRNAASALGVLKARRAVESLIPLLSVRTRQGVQVAVPVSIGAAYACFGRPARYRCGGRFVRYRPSCIGVLGPGNVVGTTSYQELRAVSVHRTEVQEALIAITGQNLGFDADAWRQWAFEHPPPSEPPR